MYAGRVVEEGPSARGPRPRPAPVHAGAVGGVPDDRRPGRAVRAARAARRPAVARRPADAAARSTRAARRRSTVCRTERRAAARRSAPGTQRRLRARRRRRWHVTELAGPVARGAPACPAYASADAAAAGRAGRRRRRPGARPRRDRRPGRRVRLRQDHAGPDPARPGAARGRARSWYDGEPLRLRRARR